MPVSFSTISIASAPHIRHTDPTPRAPLGAEQKRQRQVERNDKQARIDEAVSAWFSDTMACTDKLAAEFKLKPKYFHDLFFQGGARMVKHQENINPYNAFKSEKAVECRERTCSPPLHLS